MKRIDFEGLIQHEWFKSQIFSQEEAMMMTETYLSSKIMLSYVGKGVANLLYKHLFLKR